MKVHDFYTSLLHVHVYMYMCMCIFRYEGDSMPEVYLSIILPFIHSQDDFWCHPEGVKEGKREREGGRERGKKKNIVEIV